MQLKDTFLNRRTSQFLTIYEMANIHRASEVLGLTQPALSSSLRQLEAELGAPLFERSVKGLIPTSAGKIYYRYACTLRQSALYAAAEISEQMSGNLGPLRIGAGVVWSTAIVPQTLVKLNKIYPKLVIELVSGVADQLAASFEASKIDIIVAAGSIIQLNAPEFERQFLVNTPMVAMSDINNELAGRSCVTIVDLVSKPWAGFYEDDIFLHESRQYMARHDLTVPEIIMRTNSVNALTEFVKGSDVIIVVAAPLAEELKGSGLVQLAVQEPLWKIPVSLYYRKVAKDIEPVRRFVSMVCEAIEKLDIDP